MNALKETLRTATQIARRELTTSFRSPVALVFLGVFLIAVNFSFFTMSGFFSRGLADVRPLFTSLPLLLLLLVSALTMGGWAEERKLGTLEVLLTLPVRPWGLVIGKWLAGTGLVALALALTWPLPILVAWMGPLDPGPVIGGYVGALLVGSTWVALGLCISSRTSNQIVALIGTLVVGGVLLLVGDDRFTAFFSGDVAEWMRAFGAGSRFVSVERGVIDLRDVVYYATAAAICLALNTASLDLPRIDPAADPKRVASRWFEVGLIATNGALLLLWLSPLPGLRADLTADRAYSLTPTTRQALRTLDEPLYIDAYLSSRTHPLLAPLVPRVRDTLLEFEAVARHNVIVTLADPTHDDELAAEIGESYGIRSVPFGVADRQAQSLVNAYFDVLVRYGDQHEVLSLDQLVEVDASMASTDVEVRLADLEYNLMKAIRKVSRSFQSIDAQLAALPEGTTATLYATPATLPPEFAVSVDRLRSISADLAQRSNGRLSFEEVEPTFADAEDLARIAGVQPLAADLLGQQVFYAHWVLRSGDKLQRVMPGANASEGDLRRSVEAAIRRASPGQQVRIGLLTETPKAPPPDPNLPPQYQPRAPDPDYQALQQLLVQSYDVEPVTLTDGRVPDHLDVLIVSKAGSLTAKQRWAVDQYLMRGGAVVAMAGSYALDLQRGFASKTSDKSLRELIEAWGVVVEDRLVLDPQNAPFPIPVREQRGPYTLERVQLVPYPFFPDLRGKSLDPKHPALSGITSLTAPWASPLTFTDALSDDVQRSILLRSSDRTWTQASGKIEPDFGAWPNDGFGAPADAERSARVLAVTLTGPMTSYFTDRPSPVASSEDDTASMGRTWTTAAPDARLAVIGSSELVSDMLFRLADGPNGELHRGNLQFLLNVLDWAVEDTDLLQIRSAGAFARTLARLEPGQQRNAEISAYAAAFFSLGLVGGLPAVRRRRLPPEFARLERAQPVPDKES